MHPPPPLNTALVLALKRAILVKMYNFGSNIQEPLQQSNALGSLVRIKTCNSKTLLQNNSKLLEPCLQQGTSCEIFSHVNYRQSVPYELFVPNPAQKTVVHQRDKEP